MAIALSVTLAAAGCGDDDPEAQTVPEPVGSIGQDPFAEAQDEGDADPIVESTPAETPTATPTATPSAEPTADPAEELGLAMLTEVEYCDALQEWRAVNQPAFDRSVDSFLAGESGAFNAEEQQLFDISTADILILSPPELADAWRVIADPDNDISSEDGAFFLIETHEIDNC